MFPSHHLNYDGQLTGQKGLHSLWETMIPEIQLDQYDLSSRHNAKYLKNPAQAIWEAIRQAHMLTPDILLQEKEASKGFTDSTKYRVQVRRGREVRSYTSEFAKAYSSRLGKTINRQLIYVSRSDSRFLVYQLGGCRQTGSRQNLQMQFTESQKQTLKKECKAFRENKLLKEKLLISRQEMQFFKPINVR